MRRLPRALLPLALAAGLLGQTLVAVPAGAGRGREFDVQAHRGGLGLTVESTIASFSHGLELGVSTLELDVQITQDGHAVITHDRKVVRQQVQRHRAVHAGDPEYPYVGKFINTLTLKQVKQLDCGSLTAAGYPGQQPDPGARMPELRDIFALVHRFHAHKREAEHRDQGRSRRADRDRAARAVRPGGRARRSARPVSPPGDDPELRLGRADADAPGGARAAAGRADNYDFLQVGKPGKSPWLGGIDIDDFGGDLIKATKSFGASAISPVDGFPQDGKITDPAYRPYFTADTVKRGAQGRA